MRQLKVGDSVNICDDIDSLEVYGAERCANSRGTIVDEIKYDMSSYAGQIPNIHPQTKAFRVNVIGRGHYMILDLHMSLDIDSLPYDEWVRARDWNEVYKSKSEQIIRSLFVA